VTHFEKSPDKIESVRIYHIPQVTRSNAMSSHHRFGVLSTFTILLLTLGVAVNLFGADDPFAGTWKLNVAKSKYNPGPGPESATTIVRVENGTHSVNTRATVEGGKVIEMSFAAKTDGTPAPITGSPTADMVYVRKINNHTLISETTKAGIPVGRSRIAVSQDGKVLTSTGSSLDQKGVKIKFTAVYERQ
jgi:hypothetical protein